LLTLYDESDESKESFDEFETNLFFILSDNEIDHISFFFNILESLSS